MPMYQFRCPNGHEFEKIVPARHKVVKWCKHCQALTEWIVNNEPHHPAYREKVCSCCLGNDVIPPEAAVRTPEVEKDVCLPCPECGETAEHVLRIEQRSHHPGIQTVADSSVRFHFNWLPASDN
jgi:hypothetical protein